MRLVQIRQADGWLLMAVDDDANICHSEFLHEPLLQDTIFKLEELVNKVIETYWDAPTEEEEDA